MYNEDIELKIFYGDPIEVSDNIFVYPKTMRDIKDIGENRYNQLLNLALFNKDILNNFLSIDEIDKISQQLDNYNLLCFLSQEIPLLEYSFCDALSYFINDNVFFDRNIMAFVVNKQKKIIIDEKMFDYIQDILKCQNYISQTKKRDFNPYNEKAKELIEKMRQVKAKLRQQNKNEGLRLFDIISIVANYSNDINIFTVWDLTVYQLYESYIRILIWDDYHNNLALLPYIDDQNNFKLKHWAIKTQEKIKEESFNE